MMSDTDLTMSSGPGNPCEPSTLPSSCYSTPSSSPTPPVTIPPLIIAFCAVGAVAFFCSLIVLIGCLVANGRRRQNHNRRRGLDERRNTSFNTYEDISLKMELNTHSDYSEEVFEISYLPDDFPELPRANANLSRRSGQVKLPENFHPLDYTEERKIKLEKEIAKEMLDKDRFTLFHNPSHKTSMTVRFEAELGEDAPKNDFYY
jgi:hypothetical protein